MTWPTDRSPFGENRTPALIGLSIIDDETIVPVGVNPLTGALLTDTVPTITGLIPVSFSRITWTNPNGNSPPQYQLGTVKDGATTVGTLTFTYDGNGTLTDVYWTAI